MAKGFAATLATAGGLSALIDFGYGIAVAEALTVSKGDFAITFAITALTCTTCTEAQFIESFALNLASNQVFKGIFVGLTDSELLNKARLYAASYLNSVKQTTSYGRLVAKIGEFGNKVSGYWQPFLDKIKSLVQVTAAGKFTLRQIEHYVALATKQGNKSKVMLGKFDNGRSTGYIARAGTEHTFFDMGNKWDEAFNLVNKSDDEIWRINQKFIDNQKALGKEFYLSHDPSVATGFYYREVQYLTKPVSQGGLGGTVLNQGNNLWKIVW